MTVMEDDQSTGWMRRSLWAALLVAGAAGALFAAFAQIHFRWNWRAFWDQRQLFLSGWGMTLKISAAAMVLSVGFGLAFMAGRRSPIEPLRMACGGIVELVRGTPLMVQIMIGFYVVANCFGIENRELTGVLVLSLFEGVYLSEIFRGAVESISASQREAARAVGFDTWQTWRFVILPQALRRALPGTTGQLVSLVKDSSLLSLISINEIVKSVGQINAAAYTSMESYLPLAGAYLLVTLPLSWWARRLEGRFAYET